MKFLDGVESDIKVPVLFHQFVFDHKTILRDIVLGVELLNFDLELVKFVKKIVNTVIKLGQRALEEALLNLLILDLQIAIEGHGFLLNGFVLVNVDLSLAGNLVDGFPDVLESLVDTDEILVLLVTVHVVEFDRVGDVVVAFFGNFADDLLRNLALNLISI